MIRASSRQRDGRPLVMLGLTDENLARLPDDQPIRVALEDFDMGLRGDVVVFYAGETEMAALTDIGTRVSIGEVLIDPRLIPDRLPEEGTS